MATKGKQSATKKASAKTRIATSSKTSTTVTRITASGTKAAAKSATPKPTKRSANKSATPSTPASDRKKNVFAAMAGYFAGAWYELKQVSWPNRRATWSLTAAMIAFTGFFVVVILLLDALFKYLFELMLG